MAYLAPWIGSGGTGQKIGGSTTIPVQNKTYSSTYTFRHIVATHTTIPVFGMCVLCAEGCRTRLTAVRAALAPVSDYSSLDVLGRALAWPTGR